MQITLFKALKSIKVGDVQATAVVDQIETHVESVVNSNITRVEAELGVIRGDIRALQGRFSGLQSKLEALDSKLTFMMAVFGLAIAAGPVIAKLIH